MTRTSNRRALTAAETLVVLACAAVIGALVLPALGGARNLSGRHVSMVNIVTLGAAHAAYAADWNGRQVTVIDDALSSYRHALQRNGFETRRPRDPELRHALHARRGDEQAVLTFFARDDATRLEIFFVGIARG